MAQNRITLDVWFLQSKYTELTEKVSYSDREGKKMNRWSHAIKHKE